MRNNLKKNSFSTFLGSAEIFCARYRVKSELFDVYCNSSSIKFFFIACISLSVVFIPVIYYLHYQNYMETENLYFLHVKTLYNSIKTILHCLESLLLVVK